KTMEQCWNRALQELNGNGETLEGLINVTKAWSVVTSWLDPRRAEVKEKEVPSEVKECFEILRHTPLARRIVEWYLVAVRQDISERFDERSKKWREEWRLRDNDGLTENSEKEQELENWINASYTKIVHDIYSHYKTCEESFLLMNASADIMQQFRIHYHTNIYSLLSGKSQPYSAIPSLFKEMSKIFYRHHFRKFESLLDPDQSTSGLLFYRINKQQGEKLEPELFAWKTTDDISAIFAKQENDFYKVEENSFSAMELDDMEEFNVKSNLPQETISPSLIEEMDNRIKEFSRLYEEMHTLDLIQRTKDKIEEMLCEQIEQRISCTCKGIFNKSVLRRSSKWLYSVVYPWLQVVISSDVLVHSVSEDDLVTWIKRFNYHFCMTFCDSRISELFDVIVDFPDSKIAIDDLILCMKRLDSEYRNRLIKSLQKAFRKRLLIPGASTNDIINTYISTIKCLRLLDPSGVLLEKITGPIRKYLRTRSDATRCLVTYWMDDESNNELVEELGRTDNSVEDHINNEINLSDDNWVPDPMDAGPEYKSSIYRSADIISLLVSLFDDIELITNEIQNQMATLLLSKVDYDTGREQTKLELFKIRFGESKMAPTEVMVKDIVDSKRMDGNIYNEMTILKAAGFESGANEAILHGSIISKLFWPPLKTEEFDVPDPILSPEENCNGCRHPGKLSSSWNCKIAIWNLKFYLYKRP
ncbi:54_t:CDS:10, partial [Acaulospora morrowiae]